MQTAIAQVAKLFLGTSKQWRGAWAKKGLIRDRRLPWAFFCSPAPWSTGGHFMKNFLLLEREKASGVKMDTFSGAKQDIGVAKQTKEGFRKSQ